MDEPRSEIKPPPPAPPSWSGLLPLVCALGIMGVLGLTLLFLFDPAHHALYPTCLFKKLSGYDCPGCGGLRAVHELLHGHVAAALRLNAMVVIGFPLAIVWAIRAGRRASQPGQSQPGGRTLWPWLVVAGIILFGLIRNLPVWPFGITPR